MSALTPSAGVATSGPGALPPAPRRGELRIADRVFSRIAERAIGDSLAEHWAGRAERGGPPTVSVRLVRGIARLTLHLDLPFPADLAALAGTARRAAAGRVAELTGTPVEEVTVVVERLVQAEAPR
ncbi:hypothetical protein AB0D08_16895 [Kitasatospora sp. NPDC048540]|uniref:hypothetical protein n=1 Tax=unclassified Kitasatospora TaxID=2633591 RepID=UPI00068BA0DA|nr:hypothetical protein [Kitasatospora sp. MBT63]